MPENKSMVDALWDGGFIRKNLYPGESNYFKANPNVSGMAAQDNKVILNPYSHPSVNQSAVALNEFARLFMRNSPQNAPAFQLSPEQEAALSSTTYKSASDQDRRDTIAARLFSGDPSAGEPTSEQNAYVSKLAGLLMNWAQK